jgi:hypothetical protein
MKKISLFIVIYSVLSLFYIFEKEGMQGKARLTVSLLRYLLFNMKKDKREHYLLLGSNKNCEKLWIQNFLKKLTLSFAIHVGNLLTLIMSFVISVE